MDRKAITRRQALRIGGGTALAGLVAGMSGCSSIPGVGGGGGQSYSEWLHEPGTLRDDEDHYTFVHYETSGFIDNEDEFDDQTFNDITEDIEDSISVVDLDFDEIDTLLATNASTVLTGSFGTDDVADELENQGTPPYPFDDESDHEGFTVYLSDDETRAVGVSSDAIVLSRRRFAGSNSDPEGDVEDVVDVSIGEENRYADENEDLDTAISELGGGSLVFAGTGDEADETDLASGTFDHQVAGGQNLQVNGDTSEGTWVRVYADEGDVDTGDLEDWIEENDGTDEQFDDYDDLSVSQSGRVGIVTGTIDTDDI